MRYTWGIIPEKLPAIGDAVVVRGSGRVVGRVVQVHGAIDTEPATRHLHWYDVELDGAYTESEEYLRGWPVFDVAPATGRQVDG